MWHDFLNRCKIHISSVQKRYTNGLITPILSLYKPIAASEMEDEVMSAFCSNEKSNGVVQ
jgi:hypothetical protein